MSRVIDQKNTWGSQGGPNPQRSDLWAIDFSQVITGLNNQIELSGKDIKSNLSKIPADLAAYYISSVRMPTLKVRACEVRRDSRPYMMPDFDDPTSEICATFILDSTTNASRSKVYQFLESWRAFVRAGRGPMSGEQAVTQLNTKFRVEFRFPVVITWLRGNANPKLTRLNSLVGQEYYGNVSALNEELDGLSADDRTARTQQILGEAGIFQTFNAVENPLEAWSIWMIDKMWLSSFKTSDLDYSKGNEIVKIEATFHAENILDLTK